MNEKDMNSMTRAMMKARNASGAGEPHIRDTHDLLHSMKAAVQLGSTLSDEYSHRLKLLMNRASMTEDGLYAKLHRWTGETKRSGVKPVARQIVDRERKRADRGMEKAWFVARERHGDNAASRFKDVCKRFAKCSGGRLMGWLDSGEEMERRIADATLSLDRAARIEHSVNAIEAIEKQKPALIAAAFGRDPRGAQRASDKAVDEMDPPAVTPIEMTVSSRWKPKRKEAVR